MSDHDLNLDELMATFLAEADEDIAALEGGLLALEDAPDDAELRLDLLRRAHTLKGNASIVGLNALTAFAHAYEERLEDLGQVDASLIELLLSGIDAFRRLAERDELTDPDRALIAKLTDRDAVAAPAGEAGPSAPQAARRAHVRVAAEKLDRMLDVAGEIAIARGRVQLMLGTRAADVDALIEVERQIDQLQGELQELIMRARMVPIGPMFRQYARTVRDLAAAHGKNVRLTTIGEDVDLDTSAVELLRDPLTHMIRNAIDHGIETSSERVANGKPATGRITLEARHEAGAIVIRVSDDGAGLNRAAISARAQALNLADSERAIFEPGFSTSREVTDLSGRGVGMDVVRRGIEALRGTIAISSTEGKGTTFTIRLPLTLAVIDGFGISAGDETWIVPMENVVECVELPASEAAPSGAAAALAAGSQAEAEAASQLTGVFLLRDTTIPYVRLRTLFATKGPLAERENVLVVQHDGVRAGLVVDTLHGSAHAVIKPLGNYFSEVPGVAGSTILGNGRVALILDTAAVLRRLEEAAS